MKTITYDETKWCLVPVEPDEAMQAAGAAATRFDTTALNKLWTGNAVFRAMIAAAPPADEQAQPISAEQIQTIRDESLRLLDANTPKTAQQDADKVDEQPVTDTPLVDALTRRWDDDGATRGLAYIELRDLARGLELVARGDAKPIMPEGWRLVPVDPTPEMRKSAADAWLDCSSRLVLNKASSAVRAGIETAPEPPKDWRLQQVDDKVDSNPVAYVTGYDLSRILRWCDGHPVASKLPIGTYLYCAPTKDPAMAGDEWLSALECLLHTSIGSDNCHAAILAHARKRVQPDIGQGHFAGIHVWIGQRQVKKLLSEIEIINSLGARILLSAEADKAIRELTDPYGENNV